MSLVSNNILYDFAPTRRILLLSIKRLFEAQQHQPTCPQATIILLQYCKLDYVLT